ncbi:MAG: toxin-antitoxin system YwqK family antitoxin [Bacteroidota bacterium]
MKDSICIALGGILALALTACGGPKTITSHFDSGELKAEWTINSAGEKHGLETQYHVTGETKGIIKWTEGKMDSTATYYWKNGKPRKSVEYKMGVVDGKTTWYYENGNQKKLEQYKQFEGQEAGVKVDASWEYYEDGGKKSLVNYDKGVRSGPSTTWYANGQKETELTYKSGRPNGSYVVFHESGPIFQSGSMYFGQKEGNWREYNEDGQELMETYYVGDALNGAFTIYYPATGKIKALGEFRKGALHGEVVVLNGSGQIVKRQLWQFGASQDGTNDLSWFPRDLSIQPEDLLGD